MQALEVVADRRAILLPTGLTLSLQIHSFWRVISLLITYSDLIVIVLTVQTLRTP